MRTAKFLFFPVLALQIVLSAACTTTVPATVTMGPGGPIVTDPKLFVSATEQSARIVQSLRDAGFVTVDRWNEADYALEVKVGNSRETRECGNVNNVIYTLTHSGQRVLIIKARGQTGSCTPSVFDDLSQKLGTFYLSSGTGV